MIISRDYFVWSQKFPEVKNNRIEKESGHIDEYTESSLSGRQSVGDISKNVQKTLSSSR